MAKVTLPAEGLDGTPNCPTCGRRLLGRLPTKRGGDKYSDRLLALAMTMLEQNGVNPRHAKGELDFRDAAQAIVEEIVERTEA